MGHSPVPGQPTGVRLDRRTALKRGVLVGGALVWAAPVVQAVSLTAAHAESPSSPPQGPPHGGNPPGQPTAHPAPPTNHAPAPPGALPPPQQPTPSASTSPAPTGELAFTGPGLPVVPTVAVAASMIATGAAAQAVGRRRAADFDDAEDEFA